MAFSFRPARMEQAGLFVALAGGTNSGKTFSCAAPRARHCRARRQDRPR